MDGHVHLIKSNIYSYLIKSNIYSYLGKLSELDYNDVS